MDPMNVGYSYQQYTDLSEGVLKIDAALETRQEAWIEKIENSSLSFSTKSDFKRQVKITAEKIRNHALTMLNNSSDPSAIEREVRISLNIMDDICSGFIGTNNQYTHAKKEMTNKFDRLGEDIRSKPLIGATVGGIAGALMGASIGKEVYSGALKDLAAEAKLIESQRLQTVIALAERNQMIQKALETSREKLIKPLISPFVTKGKTVEQLLGKTESLASQAGFTRRNLKDAQKALAIAIEDSAQARIKAAGGKVAGAGVGAVIGGPLGFVAGWIVTEALFAEDAH